MQGIIQILTIVIDKWPFLESLLMKIFQSYMVKKHKLDVTKFIKAEEVARKTKSTKELQKIIGRRLK